jgi:hypothetical protein
MKKAVKKTRVHWARDIRAVHKQTIKRTLEGVFKLGRMLIAAKAALDHGEFEEMIAHNLPFDASTAQRLMKIARDPRLQKAASMQVLPMAWSTLYELTKLDDAAFKQAVGSGAISEQTTLDDARALRPYTPRALRYTASGPVLNIIADKKDATPPRPCLTNADFPEVTVQQIERLVRDLQAEIERGRVVIDAAFTMSARSAAELLLAMAARYGKLHH